LVPLQEHYHPRVGGRRELRESAVRERWIGRGGVRRGEENEKREDGNEKRLWLS
jgi:hypothetical protein